MHVKEVGNTSLDYNGGDAAKFDVTFVCSYFEIESKKGGLTNLK